MIGNAQAYGQRLAQQLQQAGIADARVLNAIATTPRQGFVEGALTQRAWENTALPIGQGQTISQPYIVARMTQALLAGLQPGPVLEIGTGSGYQSAILAQLVPQLCTVERIKSLQITARQRLKKMDLHNIAFKYGDGWQGWQARAPFSGIIVTAAARELPQALLQQLADGGRMVIPLGENEQVLHLITRQGDRFVSEVLEGVRFVPLVAGATE
ncbi:MULTISPECIES: protein-L-isoaspartate(D-aspartate) O-methyltransferase [Ferrimonas]|uniref:protein-L-isoaspartate(D-aspartate) O-methyltransferase n=1 Tax=Ferrimonas TaxID=44011 RepID=UPI00042340C4|nr:MULTISPECIES: protein-L-isoaspartate(D-aspartate) O-methyltransferase [Ferrimonas]USD38527.1 protein-L-isoaspartate(D-aspartate) O-methyltransferase [Ferrimonas sp. SCSIO 43195]